MALHGEVDVALGRADSSKERPQRVVPHERRTERVTMVLGLVGEEVDPGVAVERLPRLPVSLEQLAAAA
jgi:hypothetical protein